MAMLQHLSCGACFVGLEVEVVQHLAEQQPCGSASTTTPSSSSAGAAPTSSQCTDLGRGGAASAHQQSLLLARDATAFARLLCGTGASETSSSGAAAPTRLVQHAGVQTLAAASGQHLLQPGHRYRLSGKTALLGGHLILTVSDAADAMHHLGISAKDPLPALQYCPGLDISAPLRQYAALPLAITNHSDTRGGGGGATTRLKFFIPRTSKSAVVPGSLCDLADGGALKDGSSAAVVVAPLPHTVAAEGEMPRQAACRALQQGLALQAHAFTLLPLGPFTCFLPLGRPGPSEWDSATASTAAVSSAAVTGQSTATGSTAARLGASGLTASYCLLQLYLAAVLDPVQVSVAAAGSGVAGAWVSPEAAAAALPAPWRPVVVAAAVAAREAMAAGLLPEAAGSNSAATNVATASLAANAAASAAVGSTSASRLPAPTVSKPRGLAVTLLTGLPQPRAAALHRLMEACSNRTSGSAASESAPPAAEALGNTAALADGKRCAFVVGLASMASSTGNVAGDNTAHTCHTFVLADDEDLEDVLLRMASTNQCDCVVVDNFRMDEPAQVAEDIAELQGVAHLDTSVVVVDAGHLLVDLAAAATLHAHMSACGQAGVLDCCDERSVPEMLIDAIENADVLVALPVDAKENGGSSVGGSGAEVAGGMVAGPAAAASATLEGLRALNPAALLLAGPVEQVHLADMLCTGKFYARQQQGQAGWLRALQAPSTPTCATTNTTGSTTATTPSASITWVYRQRCPFHPGRLWQFLSSHFTLRQPHWSRSGDTSHSGDHGHHHHHHHHHHQLHEHDQHDHSHTHHSCAHSHSYNNSDGKGGGGCDNGACTSAACQPSCGPPAAPGPATTGFGGQLLRSRGFVWLAGSLRKDHCGDWNQTGTILQLSTGGPWYCVLPRESWPNEADKVQDIEKDMLPNIGDRRQELAFIGVPGVRWEELQAALDACLCTDTERASGKEGHQAGLEDPFQPWPSIEDMMAEAEAEDDEEWDEGEDEDEGELYDIDEEEEDEDGGTDDGDPSEVEEEPAPVWQPGQVYLIKRGAAEIQALLDSVPPDAFTVVDWHAPWAAACRADAPALAALAAAHPDVVFVSLDVEGSYANTALAKEKVMSAPFSRRSCNRPLLKSGYKWPCYTLHRAPLLQPLATFCDHGALSRVATEVRSVALQQPGTPGTSARHTPANGPGGDGSRDAASAATSGRQTATVVAGGSSNTVWLPDSSATSSGNRGPTSEQASGPTVTSLPVPHWASGGELQHLRRGAADLKSHLAAARAYGMPLAVAWLAGTGAGADVDTGAKAGGGVKAGKDLGPEDEAVASLRTAAAAAAAAVMAAAPVTEACATASAATTVTPPAPLVLVAEVGASAANAALAAALQVAAPPVFHIYQDMKLLKAFKGAGALDKLRAAMSDMLQTTPLQQHQLRQQQQQQQRAPGAAPGAAGGSLAGRGAQSAAPNGTSTAAGTSTSKAIRTHAGTGTSTSTCAQRSEARQAGAAVLQQPTATLATPATPAALPAPSQWDPPPGKDAVAGFERTFPGRGKGVYWPKMPCLNCGCPWWQGEDWDACCMRCGWDCEFDGYDDDSRPLPKFKPNFDEYTALLKQGRTAAWSEAAEGEGEVQEQRGKEMRKPATKGKGVRAKGASKGVAKK